MAADPVAIRLLEAREIDRLVPVHAACFEEAWDLEALATLPPKAELRARTDRRPVHLYSRLEERSFAGESQEQADGSFVTHIRHR